MTDQSLNATQAECEMTTNSKIVENSEINQALGVSVSTTDTHYETNCNGPENDQSPNVSEAVCDMTVNPKIFENSDNNQAQVVNTSTTDTHSPNYDSYRDESCYNSSNMAFALQLIQKSVRSTYSELEKVHVELRSQLMNSETKCENLEHELEILQKKHYEDTQLIAQIEMQALQKYENHSNEVQNYQFIIENLQQTIKTDSEQGKLLNFYKSQNDKLLKENAALHVQMNAIQNASNPNKLEVLNTKGDAISVRPVGSISKTKQYKPVSQITTPSSMASVTLLKQRSDHLSSFLRMVSCVKGSQNSDDIIKTLSTFVKQNASLFNEACEDAGYSTCKSFTPAESADLKVLLGLTYYQYKMLSTALRNKHINILAGEEKVRQELKERIERIRGDMETGTLLMFPTKKASMPQKVAYARLPNIRESLSHTISNHKIQDDPRFQNKIWFVLGCDKGGATTKLGYEIPNIEHPPFHMLDTYNATDSRGNMQQAFDIYRDQYAGLTSITVNNKEYQIERFLNGDYKFECDCSGHQGASSSYPCLFCFVNLNSLSKPKGPHTPYLKDKTGKYTIPNTQISATPRTIDDYKKDYASCLCDERKSPGKYHHSITGDMLFPVPSVLNIVPPPLHIRLGLGDDFFGLTEKATIKVDKKDKKQNEETVQLTQKWKELTLRVKEAEKAVNDKKAQLQELETLQSEDLSVQQEVLADLNRDYIMLSNQLNAVHTQVKGAMGKTQSELYNSLEKLGVCKKLYHGGTLVGNHIKLILAAPDKLCACLKDTSDNYNDILRLWQLFAQIDKIMHAPRFLSEEEIAKFKETCYDLGVHYRERFKDCSISRKLHMLIFHLPEFAAKWKTIGLFSEQKLEALHGKVNKIERDYQGIPDPKRKLSLVFDQVSLGETTDPSLVQPKRRKCADCSGFLKKQKGDVLKCQKCGKLY